MTRYGFLCASYRRRGPSAVCLRRPGWANRPTFTPGRASLCGRESGGIGMAAGTETWTVKGVSRETREAVRDAAAGQNLTIGAWLDRALWRAAQDALKPAPPPASRKD